MKVVQGLLSPKSNLLYQIIKEIVNIAINAHKIRQKINSKI